MKEREKANCPIGQLALFILETSELFFYHLNKPLSMITQYLLKLNHLIPITKHDSWIQPSFIQLDVSYVLFLIHFGQFKSGKAVCNENQFPGRQQQGAWTEDTCVDESFHRALQRGSDLFSS